MPLDERITSGLHGAAHALDGSTEAALTRTAARGRARRARRRAATVLTAVIAVAGVAMVVTRRAGSTTSVAIDGPHQTESAVPPPSPPLTFCADRYEFAYVPPGWRTDDAHDVLLRPEGSVKLTSFKSSVGVDTVDTVNVAGFAAAVDTTSTGGLVARVEGHTPAECGGDLAVVGSVTREELRLIAAGVKPRYNADELRSFQAVWPVADLAGLLRTADSDGLSDAAHAAIGFAGDQLGWHGGTVMDTQPSENGTDGADLTIAEQPGGTPVYVGTVPLPGTNYWAVTYATSFTPSDEIGGSASITADTSQPDFILSTVARGVEAELTVRYGDIGVDLTTPDLPPRWTFELGARPDVPGSSIIRWRDANGKVIAVHATSLHAGDFAAS